MAESVSLLLNKIYYKAEVIGGGDYGSVCTVYDEEGNTFARKDFIEDHDYKLGYDLGILREISMLALLQPHNNPYIIRLHDICYENGYISILMPKMRCDLLRAVEQKELSPPRKLYISHKICAAVGYLHANSIMHRDIKTENILLSDDYEPVLADFSLAKVFNCSANGRTHTPSIGTDTFRAPEVVEKKGYSFPSDMWSVGVVLLEIFDEPLGEHKERVAMNIIRKKREKLTKKSLPLLIASLLQEDPQKRATYADALASPAFSKYDEPVLHREIFANTIAPKVVTNREIKKICAAYKFTNPMTAYAAEIYCKHFESPTKLQIRTCVILASKMYEEELIYDDDVERDILIDEYKKEEHIIFEKMNFCLFV